MKLFHTAKELVDFLSDEKGLTMTMSGDIVAYQMDTNTTLDFNIKENTYSLKKNGLNINADRDTTFDLTKPENHSVVMLLLTVIERGYPFSSITLEKKWQTGHDPIWLDVMIKNDVNDDIYMIEVKKYDEYLKYTNPDNVSKVKQLCSYAMQEQTTKIASFYTYDFDNQKNCFSNIFCADLRKSSLNTDDFYDRWHKTFDESDFISNNNPFNIQKHILKYSDLKHITQNDTKTLFNQFETILRVNSISDKPTAFIKMINLFLAKLEDEISQDISFDSSDASDNTLSHVGMRFQYIDDESPESFMKRLNLLYKDGMLKYLNKSVIDYSDNELLLWVDGGDKVALMSAFDNLRLKKNNCFSFIEVYDNTTFLENYNVVKDIVKILQNFKFKYDTKHQFLGDFFENLLNTSLKQEAGQFFTPYPLVDFMVNSLDIREKIESAISSRSLDFVPKVIDYACGAGHFLISSMTAIQSSLESVKCITTDQKKRLDSYLSVPYSWANTSHMVGIEKDYRLAKTTKIATFLNGDGDAEIIAGDGINKFDCEDYSRTVLNSKTSKVEYFDYVISNPPYSVDGFMQNFRRNNIDEHSNTFTLLDSINPKDQRIEIYFVERAEQLLKTGGIAAIVLPQSVLSGNKYDKLRGFIMNNFRILAMLLTADITFSGTTTSPVILFLRKEKMTERNYKILIHQSPIYSNPNASKLKNQEINFLGYEFSNNRLKSGIKIHDDSVLNSLVPATKEIICTGDVINNKLDTLYSKIVSLSDIILNKKTRYNGDIYPKYKVKPGKPLRDFCNINEWTKNDFSTVPSGYLEISDMGSQIPTKEKQSTRYCKKGDILISSLVPSPDKIIVAKDEFKLSSAIFVLSSFKNDAERDDVLKRLRSADAIEQMCAMLDGFKITYAKINEHNLYNNVLI